MRTQPATRSEARTYPRRFQMHGYLGLALRLQLAQPGELVSAMVVNTLLAGVGLLLLSGLGANLEGIAGWSMPQLVFCWGFGETAVSLYHALFAGLGRAGNYLLDGDLDRTLLRPRDPLLQILAENLSLAEAPVVGVGAALMALAAPSLPDGLIWGLLPLQLAAAVAVLGGLQAAVAALGFFLPLRAGPQGLILQLSLFSRYPLDLQRPPLRFLLSFLLPLGFAGFYPATLFLGRPDYLLWSLASPVVGLGCLALGWGLWRRGLARYASVGA